ncbi:MAG: hypothetical protein IKA88_03765 [Clostridia bacterium]|nr:hypothetical protein [Clostridia bacterium]
MKKSEKIITALLTIGIGILLMVMKGNFISLLMTIAGAGLIVVGVVDLFSRQFPPAVVKVITGGLIIICGWAAVSAVLYVVSAILLVFGILLLYDKLKRHVRCNPLWRTVCYYTVPTGMILVGVLFLFHQGKVVTPIFILSGIVALIVGGVLLFQALSEE